MRVPECPSTSQQRVVLGVDVRYAAGVCGFNDHLGSQGDTRVNDVDVARHCCGTDDSTSTNLGIPLGRVFLGFKSIGL